MIASSLRNVFAPTKFWGGVILLLAVFLLSACGSIEQDVTILKNEKWRAETRLILDEQTLVMVDLADVEQKLDEAQAQAVALGADFQWKKQVNDDGGVTYLMNMSGTGYDLLNQIVFDGAATIQQVDADGVTELSFFPSFDVSDYALTLHVGDVLETNGTISSKGEVSWNGRGQQVYVVFKPKSMDTRLIWGIAAALLALILIGGGILFLRSRASSHAATRTPYPPRPSFPASSARPGNVFGATNYCHRCGGKLNPKGKYCPHCGAPIS